MEAYEEDDLEGLANASFTIPCSTTTTTSSSSSSHNEKNTFPVLPRYERTAGPSDLRRQGYLSSCKKSRHAFENTISSVFDPIIDKIDQFCAKDTFRSSSLFHIPGSTTSSVARRISAASLIGPQPSRHLHDRLQSKIKAKKDYYFVSLQPRDCVSLAASIRLLTVRLLNQSSISTEVDASSLLSLCSLSASSTAVIYLGSIAIFRYAVLNDLIKALHSATQTPNFPRIVLLFGLEGGLSTLDDRLDSESVRLMDIHRFPFPFPSAFFDKMMEELFLNSDPPSCVWLGPSFLELLRYQYFERGFNLDNTLSMIELAYHHHFTTRPLSVFTTLSSSYVSGDWEAAFFDRLRLQIIEADKSGSIHLPRPIQGKERSKKEYLQDLLTDDSAVLLSIADYSSASIQYRICIRRVIHLLHTLRSQFHVQANGDVEESLQNPKRTSLGGLAWYILSNREVNKVILSIAATIRKAPVRELLQALKQVQGSPWASDKTFQDSLALYLDEIQREAQKEQAEEPDGDAIMTEKDKFEVVQRRISREEHCDAVKRNVADWLRAELESWTSARQVLPQIWLYDFTDFVTQLFDPSPRVGILAALNDPSSSLSIFDDKNSPDICRLFQLYQSAGKMLNLADLYQAFAHSADQQASTPKKQKQQKRKGADELDMEEKDVVQARFALAVNELGRMGLLKKTRRKQDHVLKIVHDLPSNV